MTGILYYCCMTAKRNLSGQEKTGSQENISYKKNFWGWVTTSTTTRYKNGSHSDSLLCFNLPWFLYSPHLKKNICNGYLQMTSHQNTELDEERYLTHLYIISILACNG